MSRSGYGIMGQGQGRQAPQLAHRLVWQLLGGVLPPNLHHECKVKVCVRPDHLRPMEPGEHKRLHAAEEHRTHCLHGHEFTVANTYWRKDRGGRTSRQCKRCRNDREKARKAGMPAMQRSEMYRNSSEVRRRKRARERTQAAVAGLLSER